MNKIYRIIWNTAAGRWVVASEFAKGRKKAASTSVGALSAVLLFAGGTTAAAATQCGDGNAPVGATCTFRLNPVDDDGLEGTALISGGDVVTVGGTAWDIAYGSHGISAPSLGVLVPETANLDRLVLGPQDASILVPDPATQSWRTVATYSSSNFVADRWGNATGTQTMSAVGDQQYIGTSIAKAIGGTAIIAIGDRTQAPSYGLNNIYMAAKGAKLAHAEGADSNVAWSSRNRIEMTAGYSPAGTIARTVDIAVPIYAGNVDFNGAVYAVNDIAGLRTYNDALIAGLSSGVLRSQQDYETAFNRAVRFDTRQYTYDVGIPPGDDVAVPFSQSYAMYIDGQGATGTILSGAQIDQYGAPVAAVNGGRFTIEQGGALSGYFTSLIVGSGAQAVNSGVMSGGYRAEHGLDTTRAGNLGGKYAEAELTRVSGDGSSFVNNGIMNVAGWDYSDRNQQQFAVEVSSQASAVNNGIVNIGVTNGTRYGSVVGAKVLGDSTFTNSESGSIHIGRAAQYNAAAPEAVANTSGSVPMTGILVTGAGTVDNAGSIVLEGKAQNADGLRVDHASGANVTNRGLIQVTGRADGIPLPSNGIHVLDSAGSNVLNSGTIELTGINAVGIKLEGYNAATQATSTGTIKVKGDVDAATGLRSYGVWAEGEHAQATVSGAVQLAGDGAIGVHARDGGQVAINGSGAVDFLEGDHQIGYFAFGPRASITNSGTAQQDVSTADSTLFRMEDGADFEGDAATQLTASGTNSTAVMVTGRDTATTDASAFNSGGVTLDLSGQNAVGVRVEGGAQGKITRDAIIHLIGQGAVAGIVDGQKHDLAGLAVGSPVAGVLTDASKRAGEYGFGDGTLLVVEGMLESDLADVIGYMARNGAVISNAGDIAFGGAHATGLVVESGAHGINTGSIAVTGGGTGIRARSNPDDPASIVTNSGSLVLEGGAVDDRTVGIDAIGARTRVEMMGGTLALNGDGAIGVQASDGASVNLAGSAQLTLSAGATDQILFHLAGAGSNIAINAPAGTVFDASSERSTVYRLDDGAELSGTLHAAASGKDATAIYYNGANTTGTLASDSVLTVGGQGANGVYVAGGAQVDLQEGTTIALTGEGATVGIVDGQHYRLDGQVDATGTGSRLTNAADLTSNQRGAVGFIARNQGTLINDGTLSLTGEDSSAVRVLSASLRNSGDILAEGTSVYVEGADSTVTNSGRIAALGGNAALELGADASLVLEGAGSGIVEAQEGAHGVLVGTGARSLHLDGAHIAMDGSGNGIENTGEVADIQLHDAVIDVTDGAGLRTAVSIDNLGSGAINVSGSGVGIAFQQVDGSATDVDLDLSASQALKIQVTGADGRGIVASTSGGVTTAVAVNVQHAQGGAALWIGDEVANATNTGRLTSSSTSHAAVVANNARRFVNAGSGVIDAAADAVAFGDADSEFLNEGRVTGRVLLGEGSNVAELANGSSLDGLLLGGTGDDTVAVKGSALFSELDGGAGGDDRLVFDGARYTYADADAIRHFETVQLAGGSTLTLQRALTAADDGSDTNTIQIDAGSTLAVAPDNAENFVLNNALKGEGTVTTATGGHAFDFGIVRAGDTGANFTGVLALGDSTFRLADDNTTALARATLKAASGSLTTVGDGMQAIGGLTFDGGTVQFGAQVPDERVAHDVIAVQTLDASAAGTVRIVVPNPYEASAKDLPENVNLLEQDDANIGTQLVQAAQTLGAGGNLVLQDQNGSAITAARQVDIAQGGEVVAQGTYDYRLTTAPADGLYINWGLTQLAVEAGKTLTLSQNTDAQNAAADLSARVTGLGNLAIEAGAGAISLSNLGNDYTGQTQVDSGTLRLDTDGAMGDTRLLRIADAAAVDFNGKQQTIGALDGQAGSTLELAGAALTIANGGMSKGTLAGEGNLTLTGGALDIEGANAGLSAAVAIADGATVRMDDVAGLGRGGIADNGTLVLQGAVGTFANELSGQGVVALANQADVAASGDNRDFAGQFALQVGTTLTVAQSENLGAATVANGGRLVVDTSGDWTLANAVDGGGEFVKRGAGTLIVGDTLTYTGRTSIDAGTLIVGDATTPDITLGGAGAGEVMVAQHATLAGLGTVTGVVTNAGRIAVLDAATAGQPDAVGTFALGGLTNAGTVALNTTNAGNTLRVKGDYVGQDGSLVVNTVLNDDASRSDRLVVEGDTAGHTWVEVRNLGGAGAYTRADGIQVVQVDGKSDGTFELGGRVVAGANEYLLAQGGKADPQDGDWYLRSEAPPRPEPQPEPPCSDCGTPDPMPTPAPLYRPETGAYLGNQAAVVGMFEHTLHDRLGEADYSERQRGDGAGAVWVRMDRNQHDSTVGAEQIDVGTDRSTLQVGGELTRWSDGDSRFHLGAMAGAGTADTSVGSRITGYEAKGQVKGYNAGLYGTWYQSASKPDGLYVDSWLQYGRFENRVAGQGLARERYDSRGWTGSVEAGYALQIGRNASMAWYVEPQAQALYTDVNTDDHIEAGATHVRSIDAGGLTTRLGARLYARPRRNAHNRVQPFVQADWWHHDDHGAVAFDGERMQLNAGANVYEVKVGAQVELGRRWTGWGQLGLQRGDEDQRDVNALVGMKYGW